jgi:hypothetical protein
MKKGRTQIPLGIVAHEVVFSEDWCVNNIARDLLLNKLKVLGKSLAI